MGQSERVTVIFAAAQYASLLRPRSPIQLSNSQRSAARLDGGGCPFVFLPLPGKMRGAERRQALVRKRRTR
jgi:hypothetical protein